MNHSLIKEISIHTNKIGCKIPCQIRIYINCMQSQVRLLNQPNELHTYNEWEKVSSVQEAPQPTKFG
jgi:hypothetical protein